MAVTQYIGARYVPLFADPIEWSSTKSYEPLTIVTHQGASYTSKQAVPVGIDIANTDYWVLTGNYNAQVEQYRQEVRSFDGRITQAQSDASDALQQVNSVAGDVSALQEDLSALDSKVGTLPEGETSVVGYVDGEVQIINSDLNDIETTLAGFDPSTPVKPYVDNAIDGIESSLAKHMVVIGDSFTSPYYVSENLLWYNVVAKSLNVTPHNYSERGAGYARAGTGGNTFASLLATAQNDTSFDNASVTWVFVYGGLNDIDHDTVPSSITSNFPAFCTSARSAFPNAKIVVMGINAWGNGYSLGSASNRGQIYYERLMNQQLNAFGAGISFISMCNALGFNSAYYDANNRHPNESGQKVIASWVLSCMFGSGLCHTKQGDLLDKDGNDVGNYAYHLGPGFCEYRMQTLRTSIDTTTNDGYMVDDINFIKEGSTLFTGTMSVVEYSGAPVFGYLGAKDETNYLYHVNWGFSCGITKW